MKSRQGCLSYRSIIRCATLRGMAMPCCAYALYYSCTPFQIWSDEGRFWMYISEVRFYSLGLKGWDYVDDWWSGCG